jgi:aryl-alcohol dehydrogenase-like predicted oxidoreductase
MSVKSTLPPVQIGSTTKAHAPLGMGCSFYGVNQWDGQQADDILAAMATALDKGITHFDTAEGYGDGESERLIGRFLSADSNRREQMFLASKANLSDMNAQSMLKAIDGSRARLQTDIIDLYYIHWHTAINSGRLDRYQ